jgi:hypothetical protein
MPRTLPLEGDERDEGGQARRPHHSQGDQVSGVATRAEADGERRRHGGEDQRQAQEGDDALACAAGGLFRSDNWDGSG